MADTTIEWATHVWNPMVGCSRVSRGCENCYAERVAHRGMSPQHRGLTVLGKHGPRWNGEVRLVPKKFEEPLSWRKPRRVFVNSMSDLFHEAVPFDVIDRLFAIIQACTNGGHQFLILTKRARRMREYFQSGASDRVYAAGGALADAKGWCHAQEDDGDGTWLRNVWMGVSVEDQKTADERLDELVSVDAPFAVIWASYEPALGAIDFGQWMDDVPGLDGFADNPAGYRGSRGLDWIVQGGESGPNARPFDITWARDVIEQCHETRTKVFTKQIGAFPHSGGTGAGWAYSYIRGKHWRWDDERVDGLHVHEAWNRKGGDMNEWPEDLRVREFPEVRRVA